MRTQHFESRLIMMRTSNAASSRIDLWLPAWVAIVVAVSAAAYGATDKAPTVASSRARTEAIAPAPGLVLSLSHRRSHNGRYTAEVVAHSPVVVGVQSWTVHVEARSARVAHAAVAARAWMPDSATTVEATHPYVQYVGHGNYRIDALQFSRAGWWNVALAIDGRRGTDSLAFNVVIPTSVAVSMPVRAAFSDDAR